MKDARKRFFFQMRVTAEFLADLDAIRRWEPDLPSRSSMARRLMEEAARARAKKLERKAA